jgi:hypothetical protein
MKIISASSQVTKNQSAPSTNVQTKPAAVHVKSNVPTANKAQPGNKLSGKRGYLKGIGSDWMDYTLNASQHNQ